MERKIAHFCLRHRALLMLLIVLVTAVLGYFATGISIRTVFEDLQPSNHPYIKTNEQFKNTFGGANQVSLMVQVDEGDIFNRETLQAIKDLTVGLQYLDAVNQFQIISLATKKLKTIKASTEGIVAQPLMWPHLPQSEAEIRDLKDKVIANPLVYGQFVSKDLKSALVTVDFIDRLIDYEKVYPQIRELIAKVERPGIRIRVVGQPVLAGIVLSYLPETLRIVLYIVVAIALILLVMLGTLRGMLLPLLSAAISGVWALGVVSLMGINLDPLGIVITFLISARAVSHAVQLILAFEHERNGGTISPLDAARISLAKLLRPGILGLGTDAGAMVVVALTPIPLLQKAALMGTLWLGTMVICTIMMVPVILSWNRGHHARRMAIPGIGSLMSGILGLCARATTSRRSAWSILTLSLAILAVTGYFATGITIGDTNPGSPILWQDSRYNQDDAAINSRFPGSDRMFVVVEGEKENTLKRPDILANMSYFQKYIEALPEVGGTVSIADIIRPVNMALHEGNPRYYKVADDPVGNAEMIYLATANSDPGDIDRFIDWKYRYGSVLIYFRDHKGDSIRRGIRTVRDYSGKYPMKGAHYRLAGGLIGILAAVNEVILSGQLQSIALALLLLFAFCAVAYRTPQAALFFLPIVVLSNTITFSFMSLYGIGLNINTLPVAALGIGLGVDYAFYISDRIGERYAIAKDLADSIRFGLTTAGKGVIITALSMVTSVVLWYFFSSLRFQAEMGLLIALWMTVSAISSLLVIPSMIYLFRPRFLLGKAG
ncbi:MAG: RND transporter [Gammaproteobacteria bacterium]|nr:MAG: RND transporter [Gammaproteobacteria bacterium]